MNSDVDGVLRVAIQIDEEKHLWKIEPNISLEEIIKQILEHFKKEGNPSTYGLIFIHALDSKNTNKFITEKNKSDIKNGYVLKLVDSCEILLDNIFNLVHLKEKREQVLKLLDTHLDDEFVIEQLYQFKYCNIIKDFLMTSISLTNDERMICLKIISRLIENEFFNKISKRLVTAITSLLMVDNYTHPNVLIFATKLIYQILWMKHDYHFDYIITKIKIYENLFPILLNDGYPNLQLNILRIMNTYCKLAKSQQQRSDFILILSSEVLRRAIYTKIIENNNITSEINMELHIYYTNILSIFENKMYERKCLSEIKESDFLSFSDENLTDIMHKNSFSKTISMTDLGVDLSNTDQSKQYIGQDFPESPLLKLENPGLFYGIKWDNICDVQSTEYGSKNFRKSYNNVAKLRRHFEGTRIMTCLPKKYEYDSYLNLKKNKDPNIKIKDAARKSLPVISNLTLDCLIHFKRTFPQSFYISVEEGNLHNPGFYITCDRVCTILCEQLNIGREPIKNSDLYCPLAFSVMNINFFLPEIFCRVMWLLVRTRNEMKVQCDEDEDKVLHVLEKQIYETLKKKPLTFRAFTSSLKYFNYAKIQNIWKKETNKKWQDIISLVPSVCELREIVSHESVKLIEKNRLDYMEKGNEFKKMYFDKKHKDHMCYLKLSSNHQKIIIGEWNTERRMYTFSHFILISEINHLVYGKAIQNIKDCKARNLNTAFSLLSLNDRWDFEATDIKNFHIWIDGLHLLLGKQMESTTFEKDRLQLTAMEVTIALLDVENIPLPQEAPPIPPPPPSYHFSTF